jgi:hypothetical protein
LFVEWNCTFDLGFTVAEIEALGEPPAWPDGELKAVVLSWSLETPQSTTAVSWHIASKRNGQYGRQGAGDLEDQKYVRLAPGVPFTPHTLEWVTLDLGANRNRWGRVRPLDVRGEHSAHAQVIQAAAYFPGWVKGMYRDGESLPSVCLVGYEVDLTHGGFWSGTLKLTGRGSEGSLVLGDGYAHSWYKGYAVPEVVYLNEATRAAP